MKRTSWCLSLLLPLLLLVQMAIPQTLPVIKEAEARPVVTFDPTTQLFTYDYTLYNSIESIGKIGVFDLDISVPKGAVAPSDAGLVNNPTVRIPLPDVELDTLVERRLQGFIVPVAFTRAPVGSRGRVGYGLIADFVIKDPVIPSQSDGPFEIRSHGLVALRHFGVEPQEDVTRFFLKNEPSSIEDANKMFSAYNQAEKAVNYMGVTVGPSALPANCSPVCMLDFLISQKEKAFNLGFITSAGVANALDAKLKEAQIKLQAGDTRVAINILKSFILDLEAQHQGQTGQGNGATNGNAQTSGKHITDNAYYLLKPNAEFILFKLGVTSFP